MQFLVKSSESKLTMKESKIFLKVYKHRMSLWQKNTDFISQRTYVFVFNL